MCKPHVCAFRGVPECLAPRLTNVEFYDHRDRSFSIVCLYGGERQTETVKGLESDSLFISHPHRSSEAWRGVFRFPGAATSEPATSERSGPAAGGAMGQSISRHARLGVFPPTRPARPRAAGVRAPPEQQTERPGRQQGGGSAAPRGEETPGGPEQLPPRRQLRFFRSLKSRVSM